MSRWIGAIVAVTVLAAAGQSYAQEVPGPGVVEVTIVPAGGMFFTEGEDSQGPSFGNYDLGGVFTVNVNRYLGFEGEVSGALGISQNLEFNGLTSDVRSPHLLNYTGNVIVSAPTRSQLAPYVTGGVGGLSLFERASLGIDGTETFLTGNVGCGVKWYAGRWGLRGDYRFVAVRSRDDAPEFFGRDTRYGHRIYGGVILNLVR